MRKLQAVRRHLAPDDPFFKEGNEQCVSCLHTVGEDIDFELDSSMDCVRVDPFPCDVKGCRQTFNAPLEYNRHYDIVHRYTCKDCRRNFPCNYLLSLHAAENHDSYFAAQCGSGAAMYLCLVESCARKFNDHNQRMQHVIQVHKYPPDFRFNTTRRKHNKYQDTKKNKTQKENDASDVPMVDSDGPIMGTTSTCVELTSETSETMNSVCVGDKLSISETVVESSEIMCNDASSSMNMDCDTITTTNTNPNHKLKKNHSNRKQKTNNTEATNVEGMETDDNGSAKSTLEKKRHVPKNISFGRGAHRGFARTKCK